MQLKLVEPYFVMLCEKNLPVPNLRFGLVGRGVVLGFPVRVFICNIRLVLVRLVAEAPFHRLRFSPRSRTCCSILLGDW